jgi:hypothetical protein
MADTKPAAPAVASSPGISSAAISAADEALLERATARLRDELRALLVATRANHDDGGSPRAHASGSGGFGGGPTINRLPSGRHRADRRPLFHEKRFEARESLLTEMVRTGVGRTDDVTCHIMVVTSDSGCSLP